MIDLPKTIETIAKLEHEKKARLETVAIGDRKFILDQQSGESREVLPRFEDLGPHLTAPSVLDIASVCRWAGASGAPDGEVHLSRASTTQAFTPRRVSPGLKRDAITRGFFGDYLPPKDWMSVDAWRKWTDKIRPFMTPEQQEAFDLGFGALMLQSATVTEVEMQGAVIQASVKRGNTTGNPRVPRAIQATIPFGDPSFQTPCRFTISIKTDKDEARYLAVHDEGDGSYQSWLDWAQERLAESLPSGWLVLVTP